MRFAAALVCLLLVVLGCGSSPDTAAPSVTLTPTTSEGPTNNIEAPTSTAVSTPAAKLTHENTHSRLSLAVPYLLSDPINDLVPMGEKIHHDNAEGHVGIDFQWWDHSGGPPIIVASADGTVLSVELDPYSDNTSLIAIVVHQVRDKRYYTLYEGLRTDSPLQAGGLVKQGETIGEVWDNPVTGDDVYMIHWEFGLCPSSGCGPSAPLERLCPMSYFEEESRLVLEDVWSRSTNQYKSQYPHICSGAFYGRSGGNAPYRTPGATDSDSRELDGSVKSGSASSAENTKQFSVECSFKEDLIKISCSASGYPSGSLLSWESSASWATNGGDSWEFVVDPNLLTANAEVTVKECQGANCSSVSVVVDTSSALGN